MSLFMAVKNAFTKSGKMRATPLRLERGHRAMVNRNRGMLLLRKEEKGFLWFGAGKGKRVKIPLIKKKPAGDIGVLQGVFEVAREGKPAELICFYYHPQSNFGMLEAYTGAGKFVGEFWPELDHREVKGEYRRLGIASMAFDLLEPYKPMLPGGRESTELATGMESTKEFLLKRGYKVTSDYSASEGSNANGLLGDVYLSKKLPSGKNWNDISEFHRVKIVGLDGKEKYWTGRIRLPKT